MQLEVGDMAGQRLADLAAEATEVEQGGPLVGKHRFQRLGPFAAVILLVMLLIASDPDIAAPARAAVVVGGLVSLALALMVPWQRFPRDTQGYLVLVPVALIVVLMAQDTGLQSPYSWLEILPLTWLVVYERLHILRMALAIPAVTFAVAFALHPSRGALSGLLPAIIMCLLFPALHMKASQARAAMLAQAERADRDPLTGLWNRRGLSRRIEDTNPAADAGVAAIYLDVDHFKNLNDRLGHHAGDELLRQVGSRLVAAVRTEDLVARLGGDEFLVITHGDPVTIKRIRDRIDRLAYIEPYQIGDESIQVTLSVGTCTADRGSDVASLIQRADRAMLETKDARHSRRSRTAAGT